MHILTAPHPTGKPTGGRLAGIFPYGIMLRLAAVLVVMLAAPAAHAATCTWSGGSTNTNYYWMDGANWGGTAPVGGDSLVFPSGPTNISTNNDFDNGTAFTSITLSGNGYVLSGNDITLTGANAISDSSGGTNTINLNIAFTNASGSTIAATQSSTPSFSGTMDNGGYLLTVSCAGGSTCSLGGDIWDSGGLTKTGTGTLTLGTYNDYYGPTNINAGTVNVGAADVFQNSSAVAIASGATLNMSGAGQTFTLADSAGNIILGQSTLTANVPSSTVTFSGVASGTGQLTSLHQNHLQKAGGGILVLSGSNTYEGYTTFLNSSSGFGLPPKSTYL